MAGADNLAYWEQAENRRHGWHNLHKIARYVSSYNAPEALILTKRSSPQYAELPEVRHFTSLPYFSGMVVARGNEILFERYASDFSADSTHSIQSISKTMINLLVGSLVEQGELDLDHTVSHYIPDISSGYAAATVRDVFNMNVSNDYTEDFSDPSCAYYEHEAAFGWRLPNNGNELTEHEYLKTITGTDLVNRSGSPDYKDANASLMGWIVEAVSGRPLRSHIADIIDAAGMEHTCHVTTDREGVPTVAGGMCLSARDLARYMLLYARMGQGVNGKSLGSKDLILGAVNAGLPMPAGAFDGYRYGHHLMCKDRFVAGGGWGGQFAITNLKTGTVAVFLSVLENRFATVDMYLGPIISMLEKLTELDFPDD